MTSLIRVVPQWAGCTEGSPCQSHVDYLTLVNIHGLVVRHLDERSLLMHERARVSFARLRDQSAEGIGALHELLETG